MREDRILCAGLAVLTALAALGGSVLGNALLRYAESATPDSRAVALPTLCAGLPPDVMTVQPTKGVRMSDIDVFVAEHAETMRNMASPSGYGFDPESLMSAAGHVMRDYGITGYRIRPIFATLGGGGLFEVCHSDGSLFRLYVDRWGNVRRIADAVTA